jgi:hypothetical protein
VSSRHYFISQREKENWISKQFALRRIKGYRKSQNMVKRKMTRMKLEIFC